jgi:hypothetical protein
MQHFVVLSEVTCRESALCFCADRSVEVPYSFCIFKRAFPNRWTTVLVQAIRNQIRRSLLITLAVWFHKARTRKTAGNIVAVYAYNHREQTCQSRMMQTLPLYRLGVVSLLLLGEPLLVSGWAVERKPRPSTRLLVLAEPAKATTQALTAPLSLDELYSSDKASTATLDLYNQVVQTTYG